MNMKLVDIAIVLASLVVIGTTALQMDLASLLRNRQQLGQENLYAVKKSDANNRCPEDEPFPCKFIPKCIPMAYLCDDNIDCDDGYDEDSDVCTAAHRPPKEEILEFLERESPWITSALFGGNKVDKVAHSLAVSTDVKDFQRRLKLGNKDIKNLKMAMDAVRHQDKEILIEELGMPPKYWSELLYIFAKLLKSGFA